MKPYNVNKNVQGVNGYGLQPSDLVYRVLFDGAAEATVTVPGDLPMGQMGMIGDISNAANPVSHNRYIAVFSYGLRSVGGDVWVALNNTATIPATNGFVVGNATLNPQAWNVRTGDVIHAKSTTANQTMTVSFYNIVE